MKTSHICQSCSMPIESPELKGTEKDGSKSKEYCIYCYENGLFTDPTMTMDDMKLVVAEQIESMRLPLDLRDGMVELSEKLLPDLKRWK